MLDHRKNWPHFVGALAVALLIPGSLAVLSADTEPAEVVVATAPDAAAVEVRVEVVDASLRTAAIHAAQRRWFTTLAAHEWIEGLEEAQERERQRLEAAERRRNAPQPMAAETTPPTDPGVVHPSYMPGPGGYAEGPCNEGGGAALSGDPSLPRVEIVLRESSGNYCRRNVQGSSACGAYQIIRGTWNKFMGYPDACSAPPWVQDEKARQLWAGGAGSGNWSQTGG